MTVIPHFITFVDDENIAHLANMADCHISCNRGQHSVEVKGRAFHLLKGSNYTIGTIEGCLPHYNQASALLAQRPPET